MRDAMTIASYICRRYEAEQGERIDEMKLHKLLYLAQRESLIRTGEPLFEEAFHGWRFGPVLPQIREHYKNNDFQPITDAELGDDKATLDAVFENYARKDSWSLTRLTHGEICWKKSRKGIAPNESSNNMIPLADIRLDAKRMKERRDMLDLDGQL